MSKPHPSGQPRPVSDEAADAELTPEARELLARVRRSRGEQTAPDDLRQRALARALAEAHRPAVLAMPAPALVPVPRPSARALARVVGGVALALAVVLGTPTLWERVGEQLAAEPGASGNWQASGPAGELLSKSSPLFRLPLLPLSEPPREVGPNLLGELPFSPQSGSWQVRLWNDPKAEPETPASIEFPAGALCVPLAPGDRVLGGWPWLRADQPPVSVPVRLEQGRAYRLSFKAWVQGPLPSQVLMGVGHTQFPFVAAAAARVQVSEHREAFEMDFIAARDDDSAGVAFLATNHPRAAPTRFCLSELRLSERAAH